MKSFLLFFVGLVWLVMPEVSMATCRMTLTAGSFQVSGCEENSLLATTARVVGEAKTVDRWISHGDGTVTDRLTGLQWEKKTSDGTVHDVDNQYSWTANQFGGFNGTVVTDFLDVLNDDEFAGHSDWRLPTIDELQSVSRGPGDCTATPCTEIPGETASSFYWSRTGFSGLAVLPGNAWGVDFAIGTLTTEGREVVVGNHARAVRSTD